MLRQLFTTVLLGRLCCDIRKSQPLTQMSGVWSALYSNAKNCMQIKILHFHCCIILYLVIPSMISCYSSCLIQRFLCEVASDIRQVHLHAVHFRIYLSHRSIVMSKYYIRKRLEVNIFLRAAKSIMTSHFRFFLEFEPNMLRLNIAGYEWNSSYILSLSR